MGQHIAQSQSLRSADFAFSKVYRYFPLRLGYVWTYDETVTTATQELLLERRVLLTMQRRDLDEYVAHWDFQSGVTQLPNVRYRLVSDGIQYAQLTSDTAYTGFAYLLRAPLTVDTTWRTSQGYMVRITAVDHPCLTPVETVSTCLETCQDAEPAPTIRLQTLQHFALDIGLVWQQRQLLVHDAVQRIDTMTLQRLPELWRL